MKTSFKVLLPLVSLLTLPAVVQAQFTFTTNTDNTITITSYTGPGGDITVPDTTNGLPVTRIGDWAFGATAVSRVTLPSTLTSLGNCAFAQCFTLTSITIPNTVTNIGYSAFWYCTGLSNATMGNKVITIGEQAFEYCFNLTSITLPDSLVSIPFMTFYGCTSLSNATLGSSISSIGGYAFAECSSLTNIAIPNGATSVAGYAFWCCPSLINATLGNSITSIGEEAFCACPSLTSVAIPASVTSIGANAFARCTSLTAIAVDPQNTNYLSVAGVLFDKSQTALFQYPAAKTGTVYTIPNSVTSIGQFAFYGCSNLTSVTIPDGVTAIPLYMLYGCSSLTNVTIPNSITSIDAYAFAGCLMLTNITLGPRLASVGAYAFENCSNLTAVHFQGNAPTFGSGVFSNTASNATAYYFTCTKGWSSAFAGLPTAVWNPPLLVYNGGFEIGDLTGWTLAGHSISLGVIYNAIESAASGFTVAYSGSYGLLLGDNQLATLSQTLATVPGQHYLLSLWLNNPASGTNQLFKVNWNTNSPATNTLFSVVNPPAFAWTNLQFLVTATDTNTTLQIQAENDPNYFGLDDISLTPIPNPTLQTCAVATNGFQLSWLTAPGVAYQVQYKTNLLQTDWSNLTASFVATNTSFTLLDTNAVGSSPGRFYRLLVRSP